jgi:NADH-quinone oxidoreductase subunit M
MRVNQFSGVLVTWGCVQDKLSLLILRLVLWVFIVLILLRGKYNRAAYSAVLTFLFVFLLVTFLVKRLLGFYVFFEISLLPLMLIIAGWGYQVERVQATFYLFSYTIFGSLPLLVFFLFF